MIGRVGEVAPACDSDRVEPRRSLVTLAVDDLVRARAFYEVLGWTSPSGPDEGIAFFQVGGIVLALWARSAMGGDPGRPDGSGGDGITLAHNVRSPAEVDRVLAEARRAGANVDRPGAPTAWGGYSGSFLDPDRHRWEVAHNPHWPLLEDGTVRVA